MQMKLGGATPFSPLPPVHSSESLRSGMNRSIPTVFVQFPNTVRKVNVNRYSHAVQRHAGVHSQHLAFGRKPVSASSEQGISNGPCCSSRSSQFFRIIAEVFAHSFRLIIAFEIAEHRRIFRVAKRKVQKGVSLMHQEHEKWRGEMIDRSAAGHQLQRGLVNVNELINRAV